MIHLKKILTVIKNSINNFLLIFGYKISKSNTSSDLVKLYKYKDYKEYKETQIYYNKQKINKVWADETTLETISNFLKEKIKSNLIRGICHGSRNGFEQNFFNNETDGFEVIGTDISETAKNYKNSYVHDFHEEKKEWLEYYDFVYSNSLDQSYDPKKALDTWLKQVKLGGFVIIEHSDQHGVLSSGKMDPFGVESNFFPYLLAEWFGHSISIQIIKCIKKNKKPLKSRAFVGKNINAFLFILKKIKN